MNSALSNRFQAESHFVVISSSDVTFRNYDQPRVPSRGRGGFGYLCGLRGLNFYNPIGFNSSWLMSRKRTKNAKSKQNFSQRVANDSRVHEKSTDGLIREGGQSEGLGNCIKRYLDVGCLVLFDK